MHGRPKGSRARGGGVSRVGSGGVSGTGVSVRALPARGRGGPEESNMRTSGAELRFAAQ